MRAVMVHEFGNLDRARLESREDPEPGPGEVLVAIRASPVNYVDLVTFRGEYQFTPALPYTPGKGPAGVVRAVGDGVTDLLPGDRVLAMAEYGGYADLVAVHHQQVYRLPDSLSFVDAAAMSLGFDTAWVALRDRARIQQGETVLVLGATGAVGVAAVQLAKAMGARRVLAGVSAPDRFPTAAAAGADGMVDLSAPDLRDDLRRQVFAGNEGAGVDVVIDPLGGDPFDGAIRALAWRGRHVVIGFAAGRIPVLRANYPLLKNIEVSGLQISDYRKRMPELMRRCYREIFDYHADGLVVAPQSCVAPLSEWKAMLRSIETRAASGRLVLRPD